MCEEKAFAFLSHRAIRSCVSDRCMKFMTRIQLKCESEQGVIALNLSYPCWAICAMPIPSITEQEAKLRRARSKPSLSVLIASLSLLLLASPFACVAVTYTATDLNPVATTSSYGFGAYGGQQVGTGNDSNGNAHALLWAGTAASSTDLNPAGFVRSYGLGAYSGEQIGYGVDSNNLVHALLWSGTANSAVDLTPTGFTESLGRGVSGSQQIGYGHDFTGSIHSHALLWSGTATGVVDLNPSGFSSSYGYGISGIQQVGYGLQLLAGPSHALLWSGTAASVIDLSTSLPTGFTDAEAFGIDANGNIIGYAWGTASGDSTHAFLWEPATIPEPDTVWLVVLGALGLFTRGTRRKLPRRWVLRHRACANAGDCLSS